MRGLALAAIRVYQRWISPHKGFCCALRVHTGGDSCSAYGYLVIARFGLRRGLGLLDRRLELCGHVHRTLTPARPAPSARNPWRHKEQGHCDVPCDSPGCDLPCHGGHGSTFDNGLCEVIDCCDGWDCGRSNRRRAERWHYKYCGGRRRRHRDSAHLDALAQRIAERKRQRRS
jgi:putative component of membrane protein insertase Oxa1/YidC/SpoIIIJ protein YidD